MQCALLVIYFINLLSFECNNQPTFLNCSYELQIERDHQRKGIGRFMIRALERLAAHYDMEKLILTVLNNNQNAVDFFTSMGFAMDDTSPSLSESTGYQIMSKIMGQ